MEYTMHYDKGFQPMSVVLAAFKNDVAREPHKRLKICVERNKGYNYIYEIDIFADERKKQRNLGIAERIIKSLLWVVGGYKVYICGDDYIYEEIKKAYAAGGARAFDADFMSKVYESPFEVVRAEEKTLPAPHGGVLVFPLAGNPRWYMLALLLGTVAAALVLALLRHHRGTAKAHR